MINCHESFSIFHSQIETLRLEMSFSREIKVLNGKKHAVTVRDFRATIYQSQRRFSAQENDDSEAAI